MRRKIAILLVAMLVFPQLVAGQTLAPGTRVRVSHPSEGTRTGTVVASTTDTLEVRLAGTSQSTHLPLAEVTQLDVSMGRQRHVLTSTGMGLLVGATLGAVAGYAAGSDDCNANVSFCLTRGELALAAGSYFGYAGGVIGLVVGLFPREKWERVSLDARRIGFVGPSRSHGPGVGLRIEL